MLLRRRRTVRTKKPAPSTPYAADFGISAKSNPALVVPERELDKLLAIDKWEIPMSLDTGEAQIRLIRRLIKSARISILRVNNISSRMIPVSGDGTMLARQFP